MDWFEILEKARKLCPNKESTFTVSDIKDAFNFKPGPRTDSYHIASGWVGKLVRWNYVERVGSGKKVGHKPVALYAITKKGRDAENTSSTTSDPEEISDLDKLRDAVRSYEGARNAKQASMGKKGEPKAVQEEEKAFLELLALCDELDRKEFGVD